MKTTSILIGLLLCATAAAAPAFNERETTSSSGAGVSILQTDGATYFIDYEISLQTGTTSLNVNEDAGTRPIVTSFATLEIRVSSLLADGSTENLEGEIDLAAGSYAIGTTSASVNATVVVSGTRLPADGGGPIPISRPVVVNASCAATSKPGKSSFRCNQEGSNGTHTSSDATFADAAVSGSILDGTNLLASGIISAFIGTGTSSVLRH